MLTVGELRRAAQSLVGASNTTSTSELSRAWVRTISRSASSTTEIIGSPASAEVRRGREPVRHQHRSVDLAEQAPGAGGEDGSRPEEVLPDDQQRRTDRPVRRDRERALEDRDAPVPP